jgi:hypothetical protein
MIEEVFEDNDDIPDDEVLEIPKEIRRLNIDTHDYPIEVIVKKIQDKDIILRPQYQRDFIWDRKKSSLLIESVLLNIPLPPIYLAEEEDGSLSVIDGLQRLSTFLEYYEDKFTLRRMEGEGLVDLNKLNYSGLKKNFPKAKRILNRGNIRTIVINKDSDPEIKYDIFERLNSGSVKLNAQEIRNCIYHGSLNDAIMGTYDKNSQGYNKNGLRHNSYLMKVMNLNEAHPRYLDAEVVIRMLAIITYRDDIDNKYKSSMKLLINDFMKENRNKDEISITELSNVFELTMDKIYHVFGDKTFKRYQGNEVEKTLNRSIMDCLACTFVNYDNNNLISKKVEIIKLMDDMLNTENESYVNQNNGMSFRDSVTKWTSSKSVLKTRVDLWRRNFNSLMSG